MDSNVSGTVFTIVYIVLAILSIRVLYRKGYLSYVTGKIYGLFSNLGCIFWILFGWWGLLIVATIGLTILFMILPFVWLFDRLIPDRN